MTESAFQNALVHWVTRAEFRARPNEFLESANLTESERGVLLALNPEEVTRYANQLLSKRSYEFQRALPLTLKVAPSIVARHRRLLARHPLKMQDTVLPPGVFQAVAFVKPLYQELALDEVEASYAADLFGYETFRIASEIDGQPRTLQLRFRIDRLIPDIDQGLIPTSPEPAPTLFRMTAHGVLGKPV